ncbi:hypothetical protein V6N12_015140 [Hibiscus sabdariffa]|uniref:Uncharacterized protein n=1 Tax=Hibiscus sabdariffa TaxID=183260 RepID=A0ABR2DMQ4_9ROSI
MDPLNPDYSLQQIVASVEARLNRCTVIPDTRTYTICHFPDVLAGVEDWVRSPRLASFGPCHCRKGQLLPFEECKSTFLNKFLSRTQNLERGVPFYVRELSNLKDETKRCYSPKFAMPPDGELVKMMLSDGCFTVELFRQYDEDTDFMSHLPCPIPTLISDLLKLENQLPFFVLEKLFMWSNVGQRASIRTLPDLALRFLSQAFCKSSEMVCHDVQEPKHLLDLFRRSLLPTTNSDLHRSKRYDQRHSIQSMRSRPSPFDDFTNAVLVNCVALEQCFPDESKHFTAYACFMSCLLKQPEDVGYLRSADIIKGVSQDETSFINMLNSIGTNLRATLRECYLWKQFREIHSYYNSHWASIRRTLLQHNDFMYFTFLQILVAILSWCLPAASTGS